jgi:flagellar basal-body rod modification protein FlgD
MISSPSSLSPLPTDVPRADRVPKQNLDQEDFLELLSVQLAQQDPTKPVESTDFIAQMAQFSALEQSTQLAQDMELMRQDSRFSVAASFIGRTVTYEDNSGLLKTGTVDAVDTRKGDSFLEINGTSVAIGDVRRVLPTPLSPPSPDQP